MIDAWYEIVSADTRLTQGDLIPDCPLVGWKKVSAQISGAQDLRGLAEGTQQDVVVLTQACDLEHNKVENVLLCPHVSLLEFKNSWEYDVRGRTHQNPTERAWKRICDNISDGYVWHHAILEKHEGEKLAMASRIVYFNEVYTVPRIFLEPFLTNRQAERLRLRAPYREHLSQAFARYFMRVGLPQSVEKTW